MGAAQGRCRTGQALTNESPLPNPGKGAFFIASARNFTRTGIQSGGRSVPDDLRIIIALNVEQAAQITVIDPRRRLARHHRLGMESNA